ncbi:hypothetical protein LTR50_007177 [Elasticomyces elasticus]|nr:hypothetical protein LTR50_007177 [Elasticomyces elasticus]
MPSRATSVYGSNTRRKSTFPILRLPIELRQYIYSYVLPNTEITETPHPLSSLFQRFTNAPRSAGTRFQDNIVWRKGTTSILSASKQLHDECAEILYGNNVFVLFLTYDSIGFRFRWLLSSGLAPSRNHEFLDLVPSHYLKLIKRLVISVDHVDSYTGMIKYNVGGKGLTHGLRLQVEKLVKALMRPRRDGNAAPGPANEGRGSFSAVLVRLVNGNAVLDVEKRAAVRAREGGLRSVEEVQSVLDPLADLEDVRRVCVTGAATAAFVQSLEERILTDSNEM